MSHKPNIFGLNCELPKGPATDRSNELHVQEIDCHTTGYETGDFQMWPCQQPHQTWLALLPQTVSLVPAIPGRKFPADFILTQPLSPGNWESRCCWPKATPGAEPHTDERNRSKEGFNQLSNPTLSVSMPSHSEELRAA